jgi:hypothetical protein
LGNAAFASAGNDAPWAPLVLFLDTLAVLPQALRMIAMVIIIAPVITTVPLFSDVLLDLYIITYPPPVVAEFSVGIPTMVQPRMLLPDVFTSATCSPYQH